MIHIPACFCFQPYINERSEKINFLPKTRIKVVSWLGRPSILKQGDHTVHGCTDLHCRGTHKAQHQGQVTSTARSSLGPDHRCCLPTGLSCAFSCRECTFLLQSPSGCLPTSPLQSWAQWNYHLAAVTWARQLWTGAWRQLLCSPLAQKLLGFFCPQTSWFAHPVLCKIIFCLTLL